MNRLGIDTGGTFTDVVSPDGTVCKLPSSRTDPAGVVAEGVSRLGGDAAVDVVHGTTVATNATLEARIAPVGLLLNRGFRGLLHIGRQARPDLYALEPHAVPLPVPEELQAEVSGRLDAAGRELEPLDPEECRRAARRLVRQGARAIAVVFLHSWASSEHERRAAAALADLGVPVTTSSSLSPEFREVERGTTAALNAGLRPEVEGYLASLESRLGSTARTIRIMTSEGTLLPPSEVCDEPARLLLSGPAGGLVAARTWGEAVGESGLLTLDMGGTSTDVACLQGGLPAAASQKVSGLEVRLPCLDIHTVGAGGGSIAHLDAGGALAVGPQSAGADPGPAAYGRGDAVTVTDAHLLLGHLVPESFAGGEARLDPGLAEKHARRLAKDAGLSLRALCEGIIKLSDLAMSRALRVISLERGHDPRDDALLAFGGAGGLHAVGLARLLGMRRVIIPPNAGVLSAQGLLWAAPGRTLARSVLEPEVPSRARRRSLAAPLVDRLSEAFAAEGTARRDLALEVSWDLRYRGQSFELNLPESADPAAAFHELHQRRYGFADAARPVELVAVRVRGTRRQETPELPRPARKRRGTTKPAGATRSVAARRASHLPIHLRSELGAGARLDGPAIVVDETGTTRLDEGCRLQVHDTGALLVEVSS